MTLEFSVTQTLKDYQELNRSHVFKPILVVFFALCFGFSLFVFLIGIAGMQEFNLSFHVVAPLLMLFILFYPFILNFQSARVYRSAAHLQETQHYRISAEGIDTRNSSSSVHFTWDKIYKAAEYKNLFAIYISRIQVFNIPKRCLSPENAIALKDLLKQSLPESKIALKNIGESHE